MLYVAIFAVVVWVLMRKTESVPPAMTEQELANEGLSPLQIRRELRQQRQEARAQTLALNQATRTASSIARSFKTRKPRGW